MELRERIKSEGGQPAFDDEALEVAVRERHEKGVRTLRKALTRLLNAHIAGTDPEKFRAAHGAREALDATKELVP